MSLTFVKTVTLLAISSQCMKTTIWMSYGHQLLMA